MSPVLSRDLALDLGTATTRVYLRGRGVVLSEATVVAVEARGGDLVAAGEQAAEMLGRTPAHVRAVQPVRRGVVADAEVTERMLRYFVDGVRPSRFVRPRMVVAVPTGLTGVERRAIEDAATRTGVRRVYVVEAPMAAALGSDLPINDATAHMVVDIGSGTTDVAVISLGGIVVSRTSPVGGDDVDEAIVKHLGASHSLLLGERSAEDAKIRAAAAFPLKSETTVRVRGRDLTTGLPQTVNVTSAELRRAIEPAVQRLLSAVRSVLDSCPPELAGDILNSGLTLSGGGAQLRGLAERMRHELGIPVRVADEPDLAVIRGAGRCVEDLSALERVLLAGG